MSLEGKPFYVPVAARALSSFSTRGTRIFPRAGKVEPWARGFIGTPATILGAVG